ncbi:ATPase [Blastomyces gilchristii SLH14081]|uniref:Cation-transporting ATPase n=1 Tax=Blastomyces gilchristii (strain SLH14081) TaxID=559298 RepID=A0A179UYT4_BLAGS|nr:ATPase [Blastomyces gilchristii SLH14081]OAT12298.1 ATPase [Blastomyces gilchristii SLH14081]
MAGREPSADRARVSSGPEPAFDYRRSSIRSSASIISDVEMAQDEIYAGPMSESIPSSVASFVPRRSRRESQLSFTYFPDTPEVPEWTVEDAVEDEDEGTNGYAEGYEVDIEETPPSSSRISMDSHTARDSFDAPLLHRVDSTKDSTGRQLLGETTSQKIYVATEDLTAVIAGFNTSIAGYLLYLAICLLSCGLGYLLLRWLPRWRVRLIGTPTPLCRCQWVVVEDQWAQFTIHEVVSQPYDLPLSTVFGAPIKEVDTPMFDEEHDPVLPNLRFLDYRYIRFYYHPAEDLFLQCTGWKDPSWTNIKALRIGLTAEERDFREQVFGSNIIDIKEKSIPQIMVDEAFHPFYIFQVASLILWSMDEYYYYAGCIFIISVLSITTTTIETRSTMRRLREISHFECDVRVLRSGFWRSIQSQELVPGDVYEVSDPSLTQVPCDCLLLTGDCIVNESMLTGESVPVAKSPVTNEALTSLDISAPSVQPNVAKHSLFSGTRIVRARRPQDPKDDEAVALAMVIRTGFNTTKGALVRSMLFPKPSGFKFYRDSFRYISVMGIIATFGFIASFINFVRLGLPWHTIIVRALDLITIVVPPALPATLSIGTNFALSRLKKEKIFCISPQRVNVGGKLNVVCFDKTGTLTEDGLDVLGVRVIRKPDLRFSDLLPESSAILPHQSYERDPTMDYHTNRQILYTMATCHSLRVVDGELIGDPLDVKMFEFTGWSFEEGSHNATDMEIDRDYGSPSIARPPADFSPDYNENEPNNNPLELGVLRSFEFVSQLRRSSVIARQFGDPGAFIFVKGAPECMKDICLPESLPPDFEDLLSFYTHRGFRVIACATKHVQKLSWIRVQKLHRSEAESDLEFIGFIIFENKLKPSSKDIITELNQAHIRNIMCTGDNILTGISVARECGIIEASSPCFIPRFVEGNIFDPNARLCWENTEDSDYVLDENTLTPIPARGGTDLSVPYRGPHYFIAVTGDIFRWIVDYGSTEVLNKMLVRGQVFARMSPDEKHELVEKLQSLDYCCGFCGDGANDCGALKAADVGISLSEAEASVAAPFTSRVFDISCVPKVIREGRAALVTSFCCFKFMSLYSAIQFTSVSFLYASASNLGDFQFLFIDLLLILPIAIFMGWIGPSSSLCRKAPTSNLVSLKVLVPLLGQIGICIIMQLIVFETVQFQDWYIPPRKKSNDTNVKNSQNTALFLLSCFEYIFSGPVISVGRPFRQPMTSNVPFVVTIIVTLLFSTYMLFEPARWLFNFMQLTEMSNPFKIWIMGLALISFAIAWFGERQIFPRLARLVGRFHCWLRPDQAKQRRRFKILLEESYI